MTDEPLPLDDADPPPDTFEAELVAYLDGELEPAAARQIENRLAADPVARDKAAALKRTFDLLDYLPKPEASPNFTSRTLERLPIAKSSPAQPVVPSVSQSPNGVAVMAGVPLTGSASGFQFAQPPNRWGLWAAGVLLAVSVCTAAGYFASSAIHPYLFPHAKTQRDKEALEELQPSDNQVIENLPLYAAVDDLDFVHELAKPEYFGEDPAVSFDAYLKPPPVEAQKPSAAAFTKLAAAFKALPPTRQQAIRDLDRQLHALDAPTREHWFRVLEVYTSWLDQLHEPERKQVLEMPNSRLRLEEIRKIRNHQWLEGLPAAQRAKLKDVSAKELDEHIRQWRNDEATARREGWAFQRIHSADMAANRAPFPFETVDRRKEVAEFMRVTFRIDDEKKCRLSESDRFRYHTAWTQANDRDDWWAWFNYGKLVYDLMPKYDSNLKLEGRYDVLPEPANGKDVTNYSDLPVGLSRFFEKNKGPGHNATVNHVGKWPDFALSVHNFLVNFKGEKVFIPVLGPARPSEFKEPLRAFVNDKVFPTLSPPDRKLLDSLEGKWPEYPRELVRLAKKHNISIPGLMLPESPKRWQGTYKPFMKP